VNPLYTLQPGTLSDLLQREHYRLALTRIHYPRVTPRSHGCYAVQRRRKPFGSPPSIARGEARSATRDC
jgi:hypothetical protein